MKPFIVAGGGWAGLAAAAELCRAGRPVLLLEARPVLGGRARTIDAHAGVESGYHLFLGAYRETLGLMARIGLPEARAFERRALHLHIRSARRDLHLRLPHRPAPLNLVGGLQDLTGVTLGEKLRAVRLGLSLARPRSRTHPDVSVADWLAHRQQTPALIREIWEPICLATLNTPAAAASAEVFLHVLHDAFLRSRDDSDLLLPRLGLSDLLPGPAAAYVRAHGGGIRVETPVTGLVLQDGAVTAVEAPGGPFPAAGVVIALPHDQARRLFDPLPPLAAISRRLSHLIPAPICTVFLDYARPVTLEAPFVGVLDGVACWLFGRAAQGRRCSVAAVLSGHGPHLAWDDDALVRRIAAHLGRFYPRWPPPERATVVRAPQATFACATGVNALRPDSATPVANCRLAGDYTATGYPASLEGAVASGIRAARGLIAGPH